jgi:type II secretory pathway component PulC
LTVLDQSPGAFLAHVDLMPRFAGGRFAGWRVVRFFPGDDRFAGVDVQAGDVVRTVNGLPVEKPEQLMALWQLLRKAQELVVDLERAGAARTLRWPITD